MTKVHKDTEVFKVFGEERSRMDTIKVFSIQVNKLRQLYIKNTRHSRNVATLIKLRRNIFSAVTSIF